MDTSNIRQTPLQIFLRFLRFGALAWGGPMAQIAMIRQELVEEEKWVDKDRFNRAFAVYQVLPGPEAQELCVWFGTCAGGRWGGFLAGLGFMLPGFVLMLLLTGLYVHFGLQSPFVNALFSGIQAAVVAMIGFAVYRICRHTLVSNRLAYIALGSATMSFAGVHFAIILLGAGLACLFWQNGNIRVPLGIAALALVITLFTLYRQNDPASISTAAIPATVPTSNLATVFFTGLKGGLLTFGGAYTAIPFIREDAVVTYGWMTQRQFLDGLALSGTLPAPLVIFSTFVGYFGGGWPGALLITLGMFLPAFAFTLLGHSLLEKLISNKALHGFIDGMTAGVMGLIGVTALQIFFTTIRDAFSAVVFTLALLVLIRLKSKFAGLVVIFGAAVIGGLRYFVN
jgi:chromate transporter